MEIYALHNIKHKLFFDGKFGNYYFREVLTSTF